MRVIDSPAEMQEWAAEQAASGLSIGLVPTMGFFHEGHLQLMRTAGQMAEKVVVSLFVNPMQFGPQEDFAAYPRDLARDCRLAENAGVAVLFAPDGPAMYPEDFQTTVSVGRVTRHLCGASRPGHFDGVATVLTKLFHLTGAGLAVFGEKDFQQLAVIRRMVADLNMPIRIFGHPVVREEDGLAMSSRNTYLDDKERPAALCLYESLLLAKREAAAGTRAAGKLTEKIRRRILSCEGTSVDYISFVDDRTLEPVDRIDKHTRLVLAVWISGRVRLIDNCQVLAEEGTA